MWLIIFQSFGYVESITGNSSLSSLTDSPFIVRFLVFAILAYLDIVSPLKIMSCSSGMGLPVYHLIRWGISNISPGPWPSSSLGAISWVLVSLNAGGVISFPGFNIVSIITSFVVQSQWAIPVLHWEFGWLSEHLFPLICSCWTCHCSGQLGGGVFSLAPVSCQHEVSLGKASLQASTSVCPVVLGHIKGSVSAKSMPECSTAEVIPCIKVCV